MAFEYHEATAQTEYENAPQLKIKGSGSTYISIGDIYSMPPPLAFSTNLIEKTHLGTPKGQREYAADRPNPAQLSITFGYALGAPGIKAVLDAKGTVADFEVSYSGSDTIHTFAAVVMDFAPSDISSGGRWEGVLTLQLTGAVTETP